MPADSNDDLERLIPEICDGLAAVCRDIDADFSHDLDRERIQAVRFDAGAERLDVVAEQVPAQPFRHLAAAGIPGAEKQDPAFVASRIPRRSPEAAGSSALASSGRPARRGSPSDRHCHIQPHVVEGHRADSRTECSRGIHRRTGEGPADKCVQCNDATNCDAGHDAFFLVLLWIR